MRVKIFPPLGLATLAGYLSASDEVSIHDEHVQRLNLDDGVVRSIFVGDVTRACPAHGVFGRVEEVRTAVERAHPGTSDAASPAALGVSVVNE